MKRVLLVSYVFPPMIGGGAPRLAQFCKYLPQFGWAPTVLTVPETPGMALDQAALGELGEEVEVVRAHCPLLRAAQRGRPNPRHGLRGLLRRTKRTLSRLAFVPDWQIVWYPFAMRAGSRLLETQRFDAVMASFGPATSLLVGARLARRFGLPLVAEFRDLWADLPFPPWPTPLHHAICRRLERRVVRQAAKVIAVSDAMAAHLQQRHHLRETNVAAITNGFDPDDLARARDTRPAENSSQPITICFTGSVYGAIDFEALFAAVAELAAEGLARPEQLRLQFVGNMTLERAERAGVAPFVELHGPVAHCEVFGFLAGSDALMLMEPPGYWAEFSYGAKLFDYMLAGKPILALVEPDSNTGRVVAEMGYGWTVHPRDREGIRRVLLELLQQRPPRRTADVEREPWRRFNRRRLTERLAQVLDEAAGMPAASSRDAAQTPRTIRA